MLYRKNVHFCVVYLRRLAYCPVCKDLHSMSRRRLVPLLVNNFVLKTEWKVQPWWRAIPRCACIYRHYDSLFLGNIAPSRHLYPPPPPVKDTEEHELLWLAWDDWPVCICFPSSSRCSPAPPGGHMFLKPRAFSAGTSFSLADLHYQRANNQWQQRWVSYWIERESLFNCTESKVFGFLSF